MAKLENDSLKWYLSATISTFWYYLGRSSKRNLDGAELIDNTLLIELTVKKFYNIMVD